MDIQTNLREALETSGTLSDGFERVKYEKFLQVIVTVRDSNKSNPCLIKEVVINLESEAFNVIVLRNNLVIELP